MRRVFAALTLIVCAQTMTGACSSRTGGTAVSVPAEPIRSPEPPAPPAEATRQIEAVPDDCALIPTSGEPITTVGLAEGIDPSNALHPSNPSERLLFGQLYETLIRVDCMGRARPGLAESWRLARDSDRLWIVTLRENARFADGTPVTAPDVRAGWMGRGIGGQFPPQVSPLVNVVTVVDDRTLVIQLADRRVLDAPITLGHPNLSVAKWSADSPLPLGTRSGRLESGINPRGVVSSELTVSRDHLPPLRFLLARHDPRDLLDAGADLLVTRDPATLDYARTLPQFERVPLAWQRTHLFLSSGRSTSSPSLSDDARRMLAADAVRGESRGAQGPFWFDRPRCEPFPLAGLPAHVPTPRIVYDADDGVARDLAERFVALVGAPVAGATDFLEALLPDRPRRTFQRATGLTGSALTDARRQGTDAGYIVAVDSRPLDPCHDWYALLGSAQWLQSPTIVPLVDTRRQAVVRRGRSGLTAGFDGSVLIDDPNLRR